MLWLYVITLNEAGLCFREVSYDRIKKMAVWKTTFVSEHLNTDQSQFTKCFALVCFACCSIDDSS